MDAQKKKRIDLEDLRFFKSLSQLSLDFLLNFEYLLTGHRFPCSMGLFISILKLSCHKIRLQNSNKDRLEKYSLTELALVYTVVLHIVHITAEHCCNNMGK